MRTDWNAFFAALTFALQTWVQTIVLCTTSGIGCRMAGTTGTHDIGGLDDESGPIDVESGSKKYKLWELQTHCLVTLLSKKGLITVDEVIARCIAPACMSIGACKPP